MMVKCKINIVKSIKVSRFSCQNTYEADLLANGDSKDLQLSQCLLTMAREHLSFLRRMPSLNSTRRLEAEYTVQRRQEEEKGLCQNNLNPQSQTK